MSDAAILFPDRTVAVGSETVKVRELKWSETLSFLRELGGYLGKLIDEKGQVTVSPATISDLVMSTEELTASLLQKTTGRTKDALADLPLSAVLELVDTALALNLSDELIAKGKNIAGRFQKFAGADPRMATPASAKPMTS